MDAARADVLAARHHLAAHGWIARNAESFRHLPPPDAALWLGDEKAELAPASVQRDWQVEVIAGAPTAVDARWLDAADPAQRAELLAGLPVPGQGEGAPFAWAHRALLRGGLRLRVTAAPNGEPAWVRVLHRASAAVEAPLLVVDLERGARCVLVEVHERNGDATTVQNLQVHVRVGAGASLQHLRVASPQAADHVAHHVDVHLEADARYDQALLATGSRYHLQRSALELRGAGAAARNGAVLLSANAALDHQVQVRHDAARTHSSIEMLALGSGSARIVGNANSLIAAGSDAARVRQRLTGIPTSGQPRLVLRPHLEIHHDDVEAAHGATWGALPQDALFLARQRGLDERTALAMIIEGMAAATLARAVDEAGVLEQAGFEALLARAVAGHLAKEAAHG